MFAKRFLVSFAFLLFVYAPIQSAPTPGENATAPYSQTTAATASPPKATEQDDVIFTPTPKTATKSDELNEKELLARIEKLEDLMKEETIAKNENADGIENDERTDGDGDTGDNNGNRETVGGESNGDADQTDVGESDENIGKTTDGTGGGTSETDRNNDSGETVEAAGGGGETDETLNGNGEAGQTDGDESEEKNKGKETDETDENNDSSETMETDETDENTGDGNSEAAGENGGDGDETNGNGKAVKSDDGKVGDGKKTDESIGTNNNAQETAEEQSGSRSTHFLIFFLVLSVVCAGVYVAKQNRKKIGEWLSNGKQRRFKGGRAKSNYGF